LVYVANIIEMKKYLAGDLELSSCECCWKQVNCEKTQFPLLYWTSFPCKLSVGIGMRQNQTKDVVVIYGNFLHLYGVFTQCESR